MTRYAVGLPNVGQFADPHALVGLAVAAEDHGWDAVFLWDHVLYHHPGWSLVNPVVVALEGWSEPATAHATVAPYVAAGLTWWIEAMGWWRGGVEGARDRIEAGPPR